jgi:C4-dicarboxylate-specific signal transduction histidine kinase
MFCRIETSLSSNTSGIGLGLSICNQIVLALGGKITINTLSPGSPQGTSITFYVKAYPVLSISSSRRQGAISMQRDTSNVEDSSSSEGGSIDNI